MYLRGFEIAVKEGNAHSIMTTYGQVNGIYTLIDSCTKSTNVIMSQVLNDTMQMAYSQAAAEAIIYLLAVSLFIGIFTGISNKLVFYQE